MRSMVGRAASPALRILGSCSVIVALHATTLPAQARPVRPTIVDLPGTISVATATPLQPLRRIGHTTSATTFGRLDLIIAEPGGGALVKDASPVGRPLMRFGADGALQGSMGAFGEGPGEFRGASTVAVTPQGEVVVYDSYRARITVFDGAGKLLRTLSLRELGGFANIGHVRPGPTGTVFIGQIVRSDLVKPLQELWWHPLRRYAAVDLVTAKVTPLPWQEPLPPPVPVRTFGPQYFRQPLINGQLVEVASERLGFRVLGPEGEVTRVTMAFTRPRLSRAERLEQERYREVVLTTLDEAFRPPRWEIPIEKQAVTDLMTDHQSRIWLRIATDGVVGPEQRLFSSSSGEEVTGRYRDRQLWAAFLPSGRFLGAILLPDSIEKVAFAGNYAWGLDRDEDDLQYLVQFRLPW